MKLNANPAAHAALPAPTHPSGDSSGPMPFSKGKAPANLPADGLLPRASKAKSTAPRGSQPKLGAAVARDIDVPTDGHAIVLGQKEFTPTEGAIHQKGAPLPYHESGERYSTMPFVQAGQHRVELIGLKRPKDGKFEAFDIAQTPHQSLGLLDRAHSQIGEVAAETVRTKGGSPQAVATYQTKSGKYFFQYSDGSYMDQQGRMTDNHGRVTLSSDGYGGYQDLSGRRCDHHGYPIDSSHYGEGSSYSTHAATSTSASMYGSTSAGHTSASHHGSSASQPSTQQIGNFLFDMKGHGGMMTNVVNFFRGIELDRVVATPSRAVSVTLSNHIDGGSPGQCNVLTGRIKLNPQHPDVLSRGTYFLCGVALFETLNATSTRAAQAKYDFQNGVYEQRASQGEGAAAKLYAIDMERAEFENRQIHHDIIRHSPYRDTAADCYPNAISFSQYMTLAAQSGHLGKLMSRYEKGAEQAGWR